MTEEDGQVSVLQDAFSRSQLPVPVSLQDEPLGSDSWDMWVNHMLLRAGITVERVGTPAYGNEIENDIPMHMSVLSGDGRLP